MSRINSSLLLLFIAPAVALGASMPAASADSMSSKGATIATVNFSAMVNPQNPQASAVKQWAEKVDSLQKGLDAKSKEIDKLKANIDKKAADFQKTAQDGKLSETQNQELLGMYTDLQTKAQNIQMESQQAYMKAGEELKKDIERAAATVASKKGIELVINAEVVVYSKSAQDLTQEVIRELNSSHDKKKSAERAKAPGSKA
jgi:outer membrane protein